MPKAKNGLTDKQRRFVQEYLIDLNATQAALRAGYAEGKQAEVQGHRLLSNAKIQKALHLRQAEIAESLEVTQERVVAEFAGIGFADIGDLMSWKKRDPRKPLESLVTLKESAALPARVRRTIQSVEEGKDGLKLRLHDKLAALDKLSRFLGLYEKDNSQDINLNAGTDALERMLGLMGEHKEKMENEEIGQ
jgi:phage terminase small subunit